VTRVGTFGKHVNDILQVWVNVQTPSTLALYSRAS
jgi:hypothetical protein